MSYKFLTKGLRYLALTLAMAIISSGPSFAADVDVCLVAREHNLTLPDSVSIPMWGFAEADWAGTECAWGTAGAATSPGPRIEVLEGDILYIHLRNDLPALDTPGAERRNVSIVIPGQSLPVGGAIGAERSGARATSFVASTLNNCPFVSSAVEIRKAASTTVFALEISIIPMLPAMLHLIRKSTAKVSINFPVHFPTFPGYLFWHRALSVPSGRTAE